VQERRRRDGYGASSPDRRRKKKQQRQLMEDDECECIALTRGYLLATLKEERRGSQGGG
jgi:hypothetical protein